LKDICRTFEDQLLASNSQFYKNEKEYEKTLKGIIHSLKD